MDDEAISNELLEPTGLGKHLVELGLQPTELTEEEYFLADELNAKYTKPSLYDCIALSIAKCRNLTLLSGDGPLRKVAQQEGVKVIGTIGLLDELFNQKLIDSNEYAFCLKELQKNNGSKVRLPEIELTKRINAINTRITIVECGKSHNDTKISVDKESIRSKIQRLKNEKLNRSNQSIEKKNEDIQL